VNGLDAFPRSLDLVERDGRVISGCARSPYYPLVVKSGRGAVLEDVDGNRFIDFSAGAASLNTGTCHPRVVEAVTEQARSLLCYTIGYMYEESSVELAERLCAVTPGSFPKKVAYGLSGSDAIDGAVKFARKYTGRSEIISFRTAYHGSTYGALSASAISLNMRRGLGPMVPGFHVFPYPICARCPFGRREESCDLECLKDIEEAFRLHLPAEEVAAVLFEPIAGDAGLMIPPARYVRALADLCRREGILFVSDEVQQGFGRTGRWFAIEHFDVVPDIVVLGKAIASGMPLSALVMRSEIADALSDPGHIFTLAGGAVCCRAALATLDVIEEERLVERSRRLGDLIRERLSAMRETLPLLGDCRGLGLTIGQEIVDGDGNSDRDACARVCFRCWQRGLVLTFLGDNVLRIQPPLVITEEEALRGLEILRLALEDYRAGSIGDEALRFARGWS